MIALTLRTRAHASLRSYLSSARAPVKAILVRSAFSFHSNTLSEDAIRPDPTIDAAPIVADLEPASLLGFD